MESDIIPESHDLPNKPLVEAFVELRWKVDEDAARNRRAFRLLFARYYDKVQNEYPTLEDLPIAAVPEEMVPQVVRHRFRVGENKWPLTQLGPGILTVNETEKYQWEPFRKRVEDAVKTVFEVYPRELSPFEPTQAELRYINLIPFDFSKGKITNFVKEYLHVDIKVDETIYDVPLDTAQEASLDLSVSLRLKKPEGVGLLAFGRGGSDDKTGMLWQIIMRTQPDHMPKSSHAITEWLGDAHAVVEKWFFTLARGRLMESFDKERS